VKVVGSGHSFTDIACTDGLMLTMDGYDGVLSVDRGSGLVTVQAGITLHRLNAALAANGLALENLGDIAYQTVAGAISTGTHGTGLRYGNISTQVAGLRIVTAAGEVVELGEGDDELKAARVSLGALGVISTVTLRCVPAFSLYAQEEGARLDDVLGDLDELADSNDHAEFFWFPHTDAVLLKRNNRTDRPPTPRRPVKSFVSDYVLANGVFGAVARVGRARPDRVPDLARFVAGQLGRRRVVLPSHEAFSSPRLVRFAEMEYAVPREHARDAVLRVRELIETRGFRISFPVEVRFVASDESWLSPAFGRQTCYIAVHTYRGVDHREYFTAVESVMRSYEGRPHWGKIHFRAAADLREVYPRWDDFAALRSKLDPQGRLRNAYLDRVLGPVG